MFVPVATGDLPHVAAMMNRAYRGAGWTTETAYIAGDRTTADRLGADLRAKPEARFLQWVERPGDASTGCVWLEPLDGRIWTLGALTTDPARQNGGLGRRLLAEAEGRIRQWGGTRVRITVVNVRDTLIGWYGRRGYGLTGETEAFPYGDGRFGTPLRDDLCFLVMSKDLVTGPRAD